MRGKQWICFLLSVLLFITGALPVSGVSVESFAFDFVPVPIQPETLPDLRLGDVTGDKEPGAEDALEVLQYAVGKRTEFSGKPLFPEVADVDGNGQFAAADALEILQAAVGKRTTYTVQERYPYPKATEQAELFDQVFQQGWGYALELVDRIIEEKMNDQTGALYLSAACCSLYMSRVPYYTPYFNQSPVWHAQRLKEIAKAAPERIEYMLGQINQAEAVNRQSYMELGYYGAFSLGYVAGMEQSEQLLQYLMLNLWVPVNTERRFLWEKEFFNMVYPGLSLEKWEEHWLLSRDSHHTMAISDPFHDDFDRNWQAVYDFYAEDLQAIRDWCEPQ